MQIVAALFIESLDVRQVAGPSTRIDLLGIHFSLVAPQPVPVTITPHLAVIVRCAPDEAGTGLLEVTFLRSGEEIARNVQPLQVPPGKFDRRLVRPELEFTEYDMVEAHVRVDQGPATVVPLTLLPPVT